MKTMGRALVLVLVLSSVCMAWEADCRGKIIDALAEQVANTYKPEDVKKELEDAAKNAQLDELFDQYLNYNSDFLDRVGEDASYDSFKQAETLPDTAKVSFRLSAVTEGNKSQVTYMLVGNCCYNLNPCISLKVGYKSVMTIPEVPAEQPKPTDVQIAATFADAMKPTILGVLSMKKQRN